MQHTRGLYCQSLRTKLLKNQVVGTVSNCVNYLALCVDAGITLCINTFTNPKVLRYCDKVTAAECRHSATDSLIKWMWKGFSISILSWRALIWFFFFTQRPVKYKLTWFKEALPPIAQFRLVAATCSVHISRSAWLTPLSPGVANNVPIHVGWVWPLVPRTLMDSIIYLAHISLFNLNR